MEEICVKCICEEGAEFPEYKTAGAAGCDVCAFLSDDIVIPPGGRAIVPTGLRFEIPEGYEIQVRPRSGLAAKSGVTVLNAPGTVDSDYRGEVKVILANLGSEDFVVRGGDRIAQLVLAPVTRARFVSSESIGKTGRGEGGFGSTGV